MVTIQEKCVKLFFAIPAQHLALSQPMSGQPIIRSDDLRAENRHRILRTLRRQGPQTRAALAELTGLSAASVSTLTGVLNEQGILITMPFADSAPSRRGRPQTRIALASNAAVTATAALTIDRLRISLVNYDGVTLLVADNRIDTRALNGSQLIDVVKRAVSRSLSKHPGKTLRHISVGFQGVTEHVSGDLMWSPILGINHVPLRRVLQQHFKVTVSVNNDCRLIAEALHHAQSDRLGNSFVTVLFSHGIGMGLYLDGKPFSGATSSALELGHMLHERGGASCLCGKRGCIEAYASDYAIERRSRSEPDSATPVARVSGKRLQFIIDAARNGEAAARDAFTRAGSAIGQGLGNVFTLLDPMPVALVGRTTDAYDLMSACMCQALEESYGRRSNLSHLIHCFSEEDPLLDAGLAIVALSSIDRQFADLNAAAPVEAV
jgi:predicted NBD/HSP70 family sugar kinase